MAVSDLGPMNGLEGGVLNEAAGMYLKRFKSIREAG